MTMDIKDFYLNTPVARYKYKIQKGMYGLPQAGIITQQLLEEHLQKHGYHQSQTTPGLWKHDTHPISFSLVLDNFGVKYVGKENSQHLLDTVRHYYKCSWDWKKGQYCGLTLKWDYKGKKVHVLMPGYVTSPHPFSAPPTCQESGPTLPAHQTKLWGKDSACHSRGHTPPLNKVGKKFIQEVCEVFLFLACGVNGGLLPALSALASKQANPTEQTLAICKHFWITWHHRMKQ